MTDSPYRMLSTGGESEADLLVRQGIEAYGSGLRGTAQRFFELALAIDPRHAPAQQNIAVIYAEANLLTEALLAIERAHLSDEDSASILCNWVHMALAAGRIETAASVVSDACDVDSTVETKMAEAAVVHATGDIAMAIAIYNDVLQADPAHDLAGRSACWLQTLIDVGPADLLTQRRRYRASLPLQTIRVFGNERSPDRPLRVGYVSGDFRDHSASAIFAAVLLHHSAAIEPYFYSTLPTDISDERFRNGGQWRWIGEMNDTEAADAVHADRIDILVDLSAHTKGGRLGLFVRKPAPVQVTAWGCAHGTGLPEIDYFFADPIAVPESDRRHYAEKIWDLPCVVTFDPPPAPEPAPPPRIADGYVTFGCYARVEKLSPEYLSALSEILSRTPGSRLRFKDTAFRSPDVICRVLDLMPDIEPDRLLFSGHTPRSEHLLSIQKCDLMLDPFPHGGGTAMLEQLYMGVPVLTLAGRQAAGRTTASVLTAMGLTSLIAQDRAGYIERASGPVCVAPFRAFLLASPVVTGYVAAVEKAYRDMWRRWCDGTRG